MQGKTINGYTLQHLLGKGGMAEVWYAENRIRKKAAVKLLLPKFCADEGIVNRFQNEAEVMVALEHPNIRQVYDYGEIDGRPAIIMEYLEGDDLKSMMKKGHRFTEEELEKWWNQMADALNYTHAIGIVHRDIKPSNIFIDTQGNVRLLDFGIAKNNEGGSGTLTGSTLGTRIYMSPEQVKDPKRVDYRTDLYSLAVSFVHLLSGKAPYDSTTSSDFEIQLSIVTKPLELEGLPTDWRGFLEPYLEKEPGKRPALKAFAKNNMAQPAADSPKTMGTSPGPDGDATVMDAPIASKPIKKELVPEDEGTVVDGDSAGYEVYHGAEEEVLEEESLEEESQEEDDVEPRPDDLRMMVNGVSFVMKPVLAGDFWMGAQRASSSFSFSTVMDGSWSVMGSRFKLLEEEETTSSNANIDPEAENDEQPVHRVSVDSYYMGETLVTQALWKAVMGDNPSYFRGDDLPVEQVSWKDCQQFIQKLNQMSGLNFRLPTEAEWEYAARGGDLTEGLQYPGSNNINSVAWHRGISRNTTHEVRTKAPNELGLYDMVGNVWEWCNDWFDANYYEFSPWDNPQGPASGKSRVMRGGSWYSSASLCRISFREGSDPEKKTSARGFRLALTM